MTTHLHEREFVTVNAKCDFNYVQDVVLVFSHLPQNIWAALTSANTRYIALFIEEKKQTIVVDAEL